MSFKRFVLLPRLLPYQDVRWFCSKVRNFQIKNIGILAHIDAGKTTTTERMLFYSGKTRSLGEVHRGNTVTDYLKQERERGITICSSAVTFPWRGTKINLLDTPGHIDFTMEVEQSLAAVDGVIIVLDGSAGVEAQTLTVWSQAERYNLAKIIFVNKMDRLDSDFEECLKDVQRKLDVKPLGLQWPVQEKSGLTGIIDIITMQKIMWSPGTLGRKFELSPVPEDIRDFIANRRNAVIDTLSEYNDDLAKAVIEKNSYENVEMPLIFKAIKEATCKQQVVPVLLGSAYKNIGIQPLMDSVLNFLPSPNERNQLYDCFRNDFVGKVFKIVHDKQKGPLTLIRVLRGSMKKGMKLVTLNGSAEQIQRIYEPLADEYREVNAIETGDVGVCGSLKGTVTGDLLLTSQSSLTNAYKKLRKMLGKVESLEKDIKNEDSNEDDFEFMNEMLSLKPQIPDPVYFCSIEPPSLSYQNALETALRQLQREDPSLRVTFDEVTGQTVLGGMGELHMDIIKSRILTEYKIDADLGPLQIAYKETIDSELQDTITIEKEISGVKQHVTISVSLLKDEKHKFCLDTSPEYASMLSALRPRQLQVIRKGALAALERGPRVGGKVTGTLVKLHSISIGRGTADSFLMAAISQCVHKILSESGTRLLEPMMAIQIVAPSERVSSILGDLSRRRAIINDIIPKGERNKLINVEAPLAELSGYSSSLRTISSGTASVTMQPSGYSFMSSPNEEIAVRRAQGLE